MIIPLSLVALTILDRIENQGVQINYNYEQSLIERCIIDDNIPPKSTRFIPLDISPTQNSQKLFI